MLRRQRRLFSNTLLLQKRVCPDPSGALPVTSQQLPPAAAAATPRQLPGIHVSVHMTYDYL